MASACTATIVFPGLLTLQQRFIAGHWYIVDDSLITRFCADVGVKGSIERTASRTRRRSLCAHPGFSAPVAAPQPSASVNQRNSSKISRRCAGRARFVVLCYRRIIGRKMRTSEGRIAANKLVRAMESEGSNSGNSPSSRPRR